MKKVTKRMPLLLMFFAPLMLTLAFFPLVGYVKASDDVAPFARIYVCPSVHLGTTSGDIFTVEVNIEDVSSLRGFDFKLGYDTTVLDALRVVEGSFLRGFGTTASVKLEINETLGFVWVAVVLFGATTAEGDGTLATVSFECVGTEECAFDLYDTMLVDVEANTIDHYVTDGYSANEFVDPPKTLDESGLYAGGSDPGVVYLYAGGATWEAVSPELGYAVLCLVEYDDHLYAGTTSKFAGGIGYVYRYDEGIGWTVVGQDMDHAVCSLAVYQGDLYAGTAWNGMKLYRYEGGSSWTQVIDSVIWSGTRSLYVSHGYLLMGDIGTDRFGRWDGSNFYADLDGGGCCIYDYQEYEGYVYAAAYQGRLWQSSDTISWSVVLDYHDQNMWELEGFQNLLYMSYNSGELRASDGTTRGTLVYQASDGIISMTTYGDNLYFGTGGDAIGYGPENYGIGNIYQYDGTNVELICEEDEFGTGVQVLYTSATQAPPTFPRCDINFDGFVDLVDWELMLDAFGDTGPPGWIPQDMTGSSGVPDGVVNMRDIGAFVICASQHETAPPITEISLDGILGTCGWYVSDVTVTLTASDWISGVDRTEYSFNHVMWIEYTGSFTITNEGVTSLDYRSIDNRGNIEQTRSETIKIDKTAPTITIASPQNRNYTQAEDLTLDFSATDTVSGIASVTAFLSQDPAIIYLNPQMSTAMIHETFSIDICIADAVDVTVWQVKLKWNPAILNFVSITEGGFLSSLGPIVTPPPWVDQNEGWMVWSVALLPFPDFHGASGSGVLATITLKCTAEGESTLEFTDLMMETFLIDSVGYDIPFEVLNGYFVSTLLPEEHDIATISVEVSPKKVLSGETVTIAVTVENQGTRTETSDVTVFYDSTVIATQTYVSLSMGETETLIFIWDTTGLGLDSYLIKAEATVVPGEVETVDNTFINGAVMIGMSVGSGQTLDLSTFKLGMYALTVTAIDNAGNKAVESVTFTVATILSGVVTDEYTKEPIAGVTISILETGEAVVTNEYGEYSFIICSEGVYTIEMAVPYGYLTHDDVTKFIEVTGATEVNFTLFQASWSGATVPRTIGYWKNWDNHYTAEMMEVFINHVKSASGLFNDLTINNLKSYLTMDRRSMDEKAQAQLLASWLNVVSAQLGVDVKVDLSSIEGWEQVITISDGSVLTVNELLKQIDNLYLTDANLTKDQWEILKDILDALNNGQLFL